MTGQTACREKREGDEFEHLLLHLKTYIREIKKRSKWRRKEIKKGREIRKGALDFFRRFPER